MKMTVQDLATKFQWLRGDKTLATPDQFIIECVNWCFRDLPLVPRLGGLFSSHNKYTLDAKNHYRWNINDEFRRLIDITMLSFWTSTGGDPCRLKLCYYEPETFYEKYGLVELRKAGVPCAYTIEQENDNIWVVIDRPSNVPIILDVMAQGFPKPVSSMTDEMDISSIAEQLMLNVMSNVWFQEADDFSFAGVITDYLDNKLIPEAIQALNKRWSAAPPAILGEY